MKVRKQILSGLLNAILALLVGGIFLFFECKMINDSVAHWYAHKDWVQIPVTFQELGMASPMPSKDNPKPPKRAKSNSKVIKAQYSYLFEAKEYSSTGVVAQQVNFGEFNTWHYKTFKGLSALQDAGQPIQAYINPAQPSEAYLLKYSDRFSPLADIFLLVCIIIPAFIYAYIKLRNVLFAIRASRKFPEEPWRWRRSWAKGYFRDWSYYQSLGLLCLALSFIPISAYDVFNYWITFGHLEMEYWSEIIEALFTPMLLTAGAYSFFRRWRNVGQTMLTFEQPGIIGQSFDATVYISKTPLSPEIPATVPVRLKCIGHVNHTTLNWNDPRGRVSVFEKDVPVTESTTRPGWYEAPVCFEIGENELETNESWGKDRMNWVVGVGSVPASSGFEMALNVPVMRRA